MLVFHMLYRITQVFKSTQNWVGVSDGSRTVSGSEIHRIGPETAKHLWPYLVVLERGTTRSPRAMERRWPRLADSDTGEHSSVRYVGVAWYRHLYTRTHTLYSSLCWTGSQSSRLVVMWSNFHLRSMIWAAALSTHCKGWTLAAYMVEDTVTVVYQTHNECMYHGCNSIFCEWLMYSIHLLQMIKLLPKRHQTWGAKVSILSSSTPRHIASVEILMLMPPSVMVRSQSLDSWCGVPSHMNWVLSWFNFSQLDDIYRPIPPTRVTSFCTLLSTADGSAWKYSWVSSAYEYTSSPCRQAIAMMSAH